VLRAGGHAIEAAFVHIAVHMEDLVDTNNGPPSISTHKERRLLQSLTRHCCVVKCLIGEDVVIPGTLDTGRSIRNVAIEQTAGLQGIGGEEPRDDKLPVL
jgi:hypothetical protein